MTNLRESVQPDVRDDGQKLAILLMREDFEDAESLAYSIYRRLKQFND